MLNKIGKSKLENDFVNKRKEVLVYRDYTILFVEIIGRRIERK